MKTKPNYEYKKLVLSSVEYDIFCSLKREQALYFSLNAYDSINYNLYIFDSFINSLPKHFQDELYRLENARFHKLRRLKIRIQKIFDFCKNNNFKNCLFLTFTLSPEYLQKTTYQARKKAVRRFLKKYNAPYVANVDYGKLNGREHFHAIIGVDKVNLKSYKGGTLNFKKCFCRIKDNERLKRYITKLSFHAIKQTAKRQVLMYSR